MIQSVLGVNDLQKELKFAASLVKMLVIVIEDSVFRCNNEVFGPAVKENNTFDLFNSSSVQ